MSWDDNVYYSPEKFGLTRIGEADLREPDYSFDLIAAWKGDEGFYLGTDSGCSCPSPFENYHGKDDLTGPLTAEQAVEEARSIYATNSVDYYTKQPYDPDGFEEFIRKIEGA